MKKIFKLFLFVFTIFSIFIGSSNWVIVVEKNITVGAAAENHNKEVAYIESNPSIKYTRIEKALEVAKSGDRVIVIAESNPIIQKDCEIKSGVTLIIPFNNDKIADPIHDDKGNQTNSSLSYGNRHGNNNDFADAIDQSKRKTNLIIQSNVTLTNNGKLAIGGILGNENQTISGQTSGDYGQITMMPNSTINSYGIIDCFGYIKESSLNNGSKINVLSGKVYTPYVIYDYRGGSSTVGAYMASEGGIFPFNTMDFPNIQVESYYFYGSELIGYVDIYTGKVTKEFEKKVIITTIKCTVTIEARHNTAFFNLIGSSSSLFCIQNGFIKIKYTPKTLGLTTKNTDDNTTVIEINGDVSFGESSISLDIYDEIIYEGNKTVVSIVKAIVESQLTTTTLDTSSIFFPFSYKYSFILNSGKFTIDRKVKFLTGSSFKINKDAELLVGTNGKVIFYSEFSDVSYGGCIYPSKNSANFINNGGVCNVNGALAAVLSSSQINSVLTIYSNANLSLTAKEGYGNMTISISGVSYTFTSTENYTQNLIGDISADGKSYNSDIAFSVGQYKSIIVSSPTSKIVWQKM